MLLGDWRCASGRREIDCGQGVVEANLALGPAHVVRFIEGTDTRLLLMVPSSVLVPSSSSGPTCELAFDMGSDAAVLHAESACTDDQGEAIVVRQGLARGALPAILLTTIATTSKSCDVTTQPVCYPVDD